MKHLSMIASVSKDLGLGKDNGLLWNLKPDMAFFKETTMGHPVIMGGNTYASIGRPLPGRENIVLSRTPIDAPGVKTFNDKADLDNYLESLEGEKFILGGASIYKLYLPEADKLYLTEVASTKPADVYFPDFNRSDYDRKVLKTDKVDDVAFEIVEYSKKAAA